MTKYEVLLCIYYYLDNQYFADKNKSEEYIYYLGNINPDIWLDEGTADLAYYSTYLEICNSFFMEEECSIQDGLNYAKKYLEEYNVLEHNRFSYNIDEVVDVFNKCSLSDWEKIYKQVKKERNQRPLLEILQGLKIQPVGDGMADLICPSHHIKSFIDMCDRNDIKIKGFTWWCHVTEGHEPCGMGGPKSIYFEGWFSEVPMENIISFETNEEYGDYLLVKWTNSSDYKACYWPGFWIE